MSERNKVVSWQTPYGTCKVRWTEAGRRKSRTSSSKASASVFYREINVGLLSPTKTKHASKTSANSIPSKIWHNAT